MEKVVELVVKDQMLEVELYRLVDQDQTTKEAVILEILDQLYKAVMHQTMAAQLEFILVVVHTKEHFKDRQEDLATMEVAEDLTTMQLVAVADLVMLTHLLYQTYLVQMAIKDLEVLQVQRLELEINIT
jgi:hypothetical protein